MLKLDTHAEVFVWIGHSVDHTENQNALDIGQEGEEETVSECNRFDLQSFYTFRNGMAVSEGFSNFYLSQPEPQADRASEQLELDDECFPQHCYSTAGGKLNSPSSTKKLGHNAYERDRRKKINDLYSSLRCLLPESKHHKEKRSSIPTTISRVLKYIPELRAEVDQLSRRKEEMLVVVRKREEASHCTVQSVDYPLVSATCISNREVMVQLCLLNQDAMVCLSGILSVLDGEGLHLVNASTHTAQDGRCFSILHLQAREAFKTDIFCEHLIKQIKREARAEHSRVLPAYN